MAEEETTEKTTNDTISEETTETTESTETGTEAPTESTDSWRDSIEDAGLRKVANRFNSPTDMTKAMVDLRKRDSQARVPGKDATDDDRAAYHKAIGVPENAEGYEFSLPDGRDATDEDKAFQNWAGGLFHSQNISTEQAKGLSDAWNDYVVKLEEAQVAEDKKFADKTEAALKKEWPGGEFSRNKQYADKAAAELFGDTLDDVRSMETKDGRFVLDHPAFLKVMARVGREMDEGRLGSVLTEGDIHNIDTQISDMDKQIFKAQAAGDQPLANKLYQQQQALFGKKFGNAPIVGVDGRAA